MVCWFYFSKLAFYAERRVAIQSPYASLSKSHSFRGSFAALQTLEDESHQYIQRMHATIITDQGALKVELFAKDAPNTVANFVKLAKEGFYNGLKFHRVIPGFVAQGGCPQGIGSGGPGYNIDCELDGENQFHDKGVLSMAHAGRNTGGSQFFLVHSRETTSHLDRQHTCFGKVTEGLDLVTQIGQGDTFSVEIIED